MPPIDPISNTQMQPQLVPGLVVGVGQDQTFIQEAVLPSVRVPAQDFYYRVWDNFGLQDHGETQRGLNEHSKIILGGKKGIVRGFAPEYSAKTPLDVNIIAAAEAVDRSGPSSGGGLSYADQERQAAMALLVFNKRIQREKAAASIVFTADNYDAALQTTSVSFKTCTIQDIKDRMREVQVRTGYLPDTFVLGWKARTSFDVNDKFLDRINGGATVSEPAVVTDMLLASLLGLKLVIKGTPIIQAAALPGELPAAAGTPIWTDDSAALIYVGDPRVNPNPTCVGQTNGDGFFTQFSPSFGKTFYVNVPGFGLRYGAWAWMDDEPNTMEWQKVAEYRLAAQTMKSGYFFSNADQ